MVAEERTPEEELARQRFRPAEIAIRFDPHPSDGLPAPLFDFLFDGFKQYRLVFLDKLIYLRLALREMVVRKLLHQADDVLECPLRFTAGLPQCPQPCHINMRVTRCMNDGLRRRASLLNT